MNAIDEMNTQLLKAKDQITDVVENLLRFSEVRDSLEQAGNGINEAVSNLEQLAGTLTRAAESMDKAAKGLSDSAATIGRIDAVGISEKQQQLLNRLVSLEGNAATLQGSMETSQSALAGHLTSDINTLGTNLSSGNAAATRSIVGWQKALLFLLILNLAVVGYLAFLMSK